MAQLKFVSIFCGIGGIDLGLERAGHQCVGQVEIDPYCQKVLAKHWPDVWRYDDITKLKAEDIPDADMWTAGFPCQDISNAGKRAGIHGKQSGLFFDLMRLVRQVRPRYLLLENVAALLTRGMGTVLGELAESGYDAEWNCIPAAAVGAPHIRTRVFILAFPSSSECYAGAEVVSELQEGDRNEPRTDHTDRSGADVADADNERLEGRNGEILRECAGQQFAGQGSSPERDIPDAQRLRELQPQGCFANQRRRLGDFREKEGRAQWEVEPDVGRVANGIPARVDRLRSLGNAVVPQVAEFIGRLLMEA